MAAGDKSLGYSIFAKGDREAVRAINNVGDAFDKLTRKLDELDRKTASPEIDADTKRAEEKIGQFARNLQQRIERAVRSLPDIKLGADASAADRRIQEIRRQLAELSDKRVGVGVDATRAQAEITRLSAELSRLSRQSANVQVKADTAKASADLLGVSSLARRVDGQRVAINVNASDVSRAISLLGLLTAGLAGASALVAPAAAGLAALGPAAAAGAQGIGALAAGFSGVGGAVKALSAEETKSAAGTAVSAAQRVNSAQAIVSAQRQVERAVQSADRAAITGAQQVADARRAVDDAYEQGARQVAAASQSLARAQRDERDAQQALNLARADAIEQLQQLGFSVEEADIAQQRATIRLNEARAALAASTDDPNSDAYKTLALDVKDAELAVRETSDRFDDLKKQSTAAAKAGVDGSAGVVAAQRQVADAAQGVRDAETKLAQARADSAKQVAQAQAQLARAQQQASFAQQDAAAAVVDAQRALANAYQDTGTQGQAAANKVAEAMAGLSPEAQKFARFLVSEVIPGLHGIRDAVQATLLPRMETALRNMGDLAPVVSSGLADTGRVIGDLSVKGSEMMSSGPWRSDFGTIMASNNRVLESFGTAGLSIADAFRSISVAAGPLLEQFATWVQVSAQTFDSFITGARASGELDRWFQQMSDTLAELGHVCGQILTAFLQISQALGPLGGVLLETVGNLAQWVGGLAAASPELTRLFGVLVIATSAFSKLGNVVAGVVALRGSIVDGWTKIGGAINAIAPASVATRLGGVQRGIEAAGLAAGTATERVLGYVGSSERAANAGEKVAVAGSKFAGALTKVGSTLPVVGAALVGFDVAVQSLTISTDDAADAILKGGVAAEQARQKIAEQSGAIEGNKSWVDRLNVSVNDWIGNTTGLWATTDSVNAKIREQTAAMTPLQLAQTQATQAANAYGQALKNHGPNSWQAATAAGALALATQQVKEKNDAAAEAAKSFTDKLIEQRDTMLGSIDAEIRYQAAVDAATESIATNGATVDLNTAQGRANMQALQELGRAAIGHIDAMTAQGVAQDQITAKEHQYRDQLYNTAVQAGMSRDAARQYVDQLFATPRTIDTKMRLDTSEATRALHDWIVSAQGKQFAVEVTGNITTGAVQRASGGPIYGPGTSTSDSILARLSNNEHVWSAREVAGAGGHQRVARLRSVAAAGALPRFATGGAVQVPGFAAGGTPAPVPATGASGDLFGDLTKSAEDLAAAGLKPLAAELTDTTVPALVSLQQCAETDTPASLTALTKATVDTGRQIQATWTANTTAVTAAQMQQTGQYQTLGTNLAGAAMWMGRSVADLQARHNASWLDMRVRAGAEIGQITGPQFGGLHQGMDAVQNHATNMATWVGGQFGRIRGLTADPIRWSLDFPLNRGLVPAWNAINAFFALNRPMGPVPVAFAHGTEDHRAVIARPGQMRVWNEPETGGEAYIPLAGSKRARSTKILGAVASEFGYALEPRYFADGGLWRQMFGIVKGQFPSATLNSAYRPGDPGYHGSGRATDLGGPMMAIDQWLASRFPNSTELIHTPGINLWHGAPHTYNAATRAEHVNHVHWAMENAAMLGGAPGFYGGSPGGGGFDILGFLNEKLADTRRMVADIQRFHGAGNLPTALTRLGNDAVQGAIDLALRSYAPTDVPGAGVERWRPTVHLALDLENQPRAFDNITLRRMQQESGGNPRAINLTDINAQRGDPSRGLMQVIGATFNRYWDPRTPKDIWNPLSNIAASMRYAVAHYGSLPTAYNRPGGYDRGGIAAKAGWLWKGTNLPERVLDPRTTVAFERMVDVLNTHRGAPSVIVSAPAAQAALGAAGGGMDWRTGSPVIRAAFVSALREVLGEGIKTDVDYDRLTWRLNQVTALNARR